MKVRDIVDPLTTVTETIANTDSDVNLTLSVPVPVLLPATMFTCPPVLLTVKKPPEDDVSKTVRESSV